MAIKEYIIYKIYNVAAHRCDYYLKLNSVSMLAIDVLGIDTGTDDYDYCIFTHQLGDLKFIEKEVFLVKPKIDIKTEFVPDLPEDTARIKKILDYLKTHKTIKADLDLCYSYDIDSITMSCLHKILPDIAF